MVGIALGIICECFCFFEDDSWGDNILAECMLLIEAVVLSWRNITLNRYVGTTTIYGCPI